MSIKTTLPLLFLILLFSTHLSLSSAKCNADDKKTLLKLRDYFGFEDPAFLGWAVPFFDCCNWGGVECNDHGRVTSLSITLRSLIPKTLEIPSFIEDLSYLKSLQLSSSYFTVITGPIHRAIAHLYDLEHLDLSNNKLTGTIPGFIGDSFRDTLLYLDLSNNELSGNVTQTLGFYTKLKTLKLNDNHFSGIIPVNFNQITTLEYLDLSSNELSGPINKTLSYLCELSHMDFHNNKLSGTIPKELGEKLPLKYFDVSNNQLCGRIPASLSKFHKSSFTGNKCLCGYPLKRCKSKLDMIKMEKYAAQMLSLAA